MGVIERNLNFQALARESLDSIPAGKQLEPTFAFLDPFGYKDVPMALIRDLVSHHDGRAPDAPTGTDSSLPASGSWFPSHRLE